MTEVTNVPVIRNIILQYKRSKVSLYVASGSNASETALVILLLSIIVQCVAFIKRPNMIKQFDNAVHMYKVTDNLSCGHIR